MMNSKKKILALAISALLTMGVVSYPLITYAGSSDKEKAKKESEAALETAKKNKEETEKKKEDAEKKAAESKPNNNHSPDSDLRGTGDSGKNTDSGKKKRKVTICHVPKGNPLNKHTIHISMSAWPAHRDHHGGDYLGSCNRDIAVTTVKEQKDGSKVQTSAGTTTSSNLDPVHIISGCTGSARETLVTKLQSYYEPITVNDNSLDDAATATAVSQCLDNGDSSDSNKGGHDSSNEKTDSGKHKKGGQGQGRDSVTDSFDKDGKLVKREHRIRGCQNKDDGGKHKADSTDKNKHGLSDSDKHRLTDPSKVDSNKNFHSKLKGADSGEDTKSGTKDSLVVSDSSLDDSGVRKAFKTCTSRDSNKNKIDSNKTGKKKGDSGHKQHVLQNCGDPKNDSDLKKAVEDYKEKAKANDKKNLIVTEAAYNDVEIKKAIDACTGSGGTDETNVPPVTTVNIPDAVVSDAVVTTTITSTVQNATITDAVITGNVITGGTLNTGTVSDLPINDGTIEGGTVTSGVTDTGVSVVGATVLTGTVSGTIDGTATGGTISNGIINGGITSGGTTSGATTSGATITGATISATLISNATISISSGTMSMNNTTVAQSKGVSGRLNWRENDTPAKK